MSAKPPDHAPDPRSEAHAARVLVREWLIENEAQVLSSETLARFRREESAFKNEFDFVLIAPFPLAIEVKTGDVSKHLLAMKGRRLFESRIALAETLGPHVPLVLIVSGNVDPEHVQRHLPEVDLVLHLGQLPPLSDLARLRVRPNVLEVLRTGDPGQTEVSSPAMVTKAWAESLTLDHLAEAPPFRPGTLAARIQVALQQVLHSTTPPSSLSSAPGVRSRELGLRARLSQLAIHSVLQNAISAYFEERCGLTFQMDILKRGPLLPRVRERGARLPGGKVLLLKSLLASPAHAGHKAAELVTLAWLLRAANVPTGLNPVLLLGVPFADDIPKGPVGKRFPTAALVNELESAGWRVFPWDFDAEEPVVERYLNSLRRDP